MIGIMDWGIGGLSVYTALRRNDNTADIIYFSDSGTTPYGKLSRADLRARLQRAALFFRDCDVKCVYVACNAASSVLESDVEIFSGLSFVSIIPSGVAAIAATHADTVAVIGGKLTIESQIYQRRLDHFSRQFRFLDAQPLSAFVEAGQLEGAAVESYIREILVRTGPIDALLFACTHYPALHPLFHRLCPNAQFLDPADFMVRHITETGCNKLALYTTGDVTHTQAAAQKAFGVQVTSATSVTI